MISQQGPIRGRSIGKVCESHTDPLDIVEMCVTPGQRTKVQANHP